MDGCYEAKQEECLVCGMERLNSENGEQCKLCGMQTENSVYLCFSYAQVKPVSYIQVYGVPVKTYLKPRIPRLWRRGQSTRNLSSDALNKKTSTLSPIRANIIDYTLPSLGIDTMFV